MYDGSGKEIEACYFTRVDNTESETQSLTTQPLPINDEEDRYSELQKKYVGKLLRVFGHVSHNKLRDTVQIKLVTDPEILGDTAQADVQTMELDETASVLKYRRDVLDVEWKPGKKNDKPCLSRQPPLPQDEVQTGLESDSQQSDSISTQVHFKVHQVSKRAAAASAKQERVSKSQKVAETEEEVYSTAYSPSWPSESESEVGKGTSMDEKILPPPDSDDDNDNDADGDSYIDQGGTIQEAQAAMTIPPPDESDEDVVPKTSIITFVPSLAATDERKPAFKQDSLEFLPPPSDSEDEFIDDAYSVTQNNDNGVSTAIEVPDESDDDFIENAFEFTSSLQATDLAQQPQQELRFAEPQSSLQQEQSAYRDMSSQFAFTQELQRDASRYTLATATPTDPLSDSEPEATRLRPSTASYDRLMHTVRAFVSRQKQPCAAADHCATLAQLTRNPRLRKYAQRVYDAAQRHGTSTQLEKRMHKLVPVSAFRDDPLDRLLAAIANDLERVGLVLKTTLTTAKTTTVQYEALGPWNLYKPVRAVVLNQPKRVVLSNVEAMVRNSKKLRGHFVSRRLVEETVEQVLEQEQGHVLWVKNDKQKVWSNEGNAY